LSLKHQTWAIFCRIVDNYGDAGFCWRLAVSLKRLGIGRVLLITDRLDVLDALRGGQHLVAVTVLPWKATEEGWQSNGIPADQQADVLIEAFACDLPAVYLQSLKPDTRWITLDYLATEPWADSAHGKPSPAPQIKQPAARGRRWFVPGFSPATGGLLHGSWRHLSTPERREWRARLSGEKINDDVFLVMAFGYADAPWEQFSQELAVLPPGFNSFRLWRPSGLELSQADFDLALQACDLNFVRGEDSFIRAHWAAAGPWRVPFVWQPYRQEALAHGLKLEGWMGQLLGSPGLASVRDLHWAWNCLAADEPNLDADLERAWRAVSNDYPRIRDALSKACTELAVRPSLESSLISFVS
jgi:hypothetical protein